MNTYEYVGGNPLSFRDPSGKCIFGLSCGIEVGASAELGAGPVGVSQHVSLGAGIFPATGLTPKGYISTGRVLDTELGGIQPSSEALAINSKCGLSWVKQKPYSSVLKSRGAFVGGATISAGPSAWISNAKQLSDIQDTFDTTTVTTPFFSVQWARGRNAAGDYIWTAGASPGPLGFTTPSASVAVFPTNTITEDQLKRCYHK